MNEKCTTCLSNLPSAYSYAAYIQSKGEPITDLTEDLAAEQKARSTYDNILALSEEADVIDPIRFLREREVVHVQRFGEPFLPHLNGFKEHESICKLTLTDAFCRWGYYSIGC